MKTDAAEHRPEHRPRDPFENQRCAQPATKTLAELKRLARAINSHPGTPAPVKNMGSDPAVVLWWHLNDAALIAESQRLLITTRQAARNVGCRLKHIKVLNDTLRNEHIIEYKHTKRRDGTPDEPMIIMLLVHTTNITDPCEKDSVAVAVGDDSESHDGKFPLHASINKMFQDVDPLSWSY